MRVWWIVASIPIGLMMVAPAQARDVSADGFVAWARINATDLPDCATQRASPALNRLLAIIGTARVVALGEPVHGAHEPLALRNCLLRYLVENGGFTAIAIESGQGESRRLHDHVAGAPGDSRRLVRDSLSWGFGRFAENAELIEWMRRYNQNLSHRSRIAFYGIDMSGGERSGGWLSAPATLRASLDYLARAAPRQSQRVRDTVEPFVKTFTLPGYIAMPLAERVRLRRAIAQLIGFFHTHRDLQRAATHPDDHDWAERNAVLARQLETLFRVTPPSDTGDALTPDLYKADAVRDAAMAENLRWVLDREGPGARVLVFAHDGHVMHMRTRGGIWSVYRRAPATMGLNLRAALGKDLLIMPIVSAAEGFDQPTATVSGDSVDATLAAIGRSQLLLDLRKAAKGATAWLRRPRSIRANFSTEFRLTPVDAFDAVIFVDRLTPAHRAQQD
jgi:erythromycin esterase